MAEREEDMIIGPSPNLGSLFAGLSRTIAGAQDKRREKREKLQSEANETFRTMSNFELGQNKSFQEVATKGLYGIKNDLLLKNKQLEQQEITSEQYKLFKNNAEDSYRSFTNTSLNYDKIINLFNKDNAEGKTGDGSALKMQYFAQNADMNGVEYYTGLDGTGYTIKRDKEGNIIDKQNVKNLSNPSNLRAETVNVPESVNKVAKTWKGNTTVDPITGVITTDIAKGKEALFDSSRASLMHQLTNTPEKAYSVLADNGGGELTEYKYFQDYEGYFNEEQKQKLIKERLTEAKIAMSNGYSKYIGDDANGIAQYEPVEGREMTKEEEEQFIKDQEKFLIKWKPDGSNNLVIDTDDPSWQNALQEARNIVGRAVDMTIYSKQSRPYKRKTNNKPKKNVSFKWFQLDNYEAMESAVAKNNTSLINSLVEKVPSDKNTFYEWDSNKKQFKIYDREEGNENKKFPVYKNNPNDPKQKELGKGFTGNYISLQNLRTIIFGKNWATKMEELRTLRNEQGGNNKNNNKPKQGDGSGDDIFK